MDVIYALVDPRHQEVRYVGRTGHLDRRIYDYAKPYSRLLTTHWIRELRSLKLAPVVQILEKVPLELSAASERSWIVHMRACGFPFRNQTNTNLWSKSKEPLKVIKAYHYVSWNASSIGRKSGSGFTDFSALYFK
jgi:hypothetical protein